MRKMYAVKRLNDGKYMYAEGGELYNGTFHFFAESGDGDLYFGIEAAESWIERFYKIFPESDDTFTILPIYQKD